MTGEKQGIEKMLEEFEEVISKELEGILVANNKERFDMCERILSNEGTTKSFLRSAIETAFKEVSTADFSRQTARIFKNEAHQRGYIAALSDYDQAVDKYLGK